MIAPAQTYERTFAVIGRTPSALLAGRQRALLERLQALGDQQACALDKGDIALLARLTELRGKVVSDAAADLPPRAPWVPELAGLVARVHGRAEHLQHSIHACMAVVRRDLTTLTQRQPATLYPSGTLPHGDNRDAHGGA